MKWKARYLNLPEQYKSLKKEIDRKMQKVMKEGAFILRKDVEEFENNIKKLLKVKYVIGVNSGTDALYLSLKALGLKKGDEVITIALVPYAVFAILNTGAKPVLVDVKDDFMMDFDKVEKAITKRTKAIIPVHLTGRACEMKRCMQLAKKYRLKVIEDAAPSILAKYGNKYVGTFGDVGCFSTHPMKNLSCAGDGGFITTNNKKLADKLRILRNLGKPGRIESIEFGYNSRLDNLQAAILNVKLKKIKSWTNKRRRVARFYNMNLSDLPLDLPKESPDRLDVWNSFVIRTPHQKQLYNYLKKSNIEVFIQWTKPIYKIKVLNLKNFKLLKTEQLCKEQIFIPIHSSLTNKQLKYIVKVIERFKYHS